MELRHLRVFLALSEDLHFGRTARRLHVAQSAVSQTVRDLESELSARLFERTSRHVKLTAAGQDFLSYAREAVQAVDRGVKAARAAQGGGGRLRLRILPAASLTRVPALLGRFQQENPLTVLEVRDGSSARNIEALAGAFCDVALVSSASAKRLGPEYAQAALELSPLCLIVPRRHRLARQAEVQLKELAGERLLGLQRDEEPDVRSHLDTRLAELGTHQTAIELSHPQALLPLIAAGLGVAILPAFMLREPLPKLRAIPLAIPAKGGIFATWNKQRISEPTRRFLALIPALFP